jgi:hypothetical protein
MSTYDFWSEVSLRPETKKWRPCLGNSESCDRRVFGGESDRRCNPCSNYLNMTENPGAPKTKRRRGRVSKVPRPFGRTKP